MISIDLSKQQALNADPKAIQQISFIGNLERSRNKNQKKHFRFFVGNCESIANLICFEI